MELIDGGHGGIERGVEADGVVGAANIIVDGAGEAYAGDAVFDFEVMGAVIGAVSTDDDESFDFMFF